MVVTDWYADWKADRRLIGNLQNSATHLKVLGLTDPDIVVISIENHYCKKSAMPVYYSSLGFGVAG
jgi:hypothetical protein